MIFVTVGTQDKEFRRLLVEVERLIKCGKINDTVVAQIGNTKFSTDLDSSKMHLIEFTTPREVDALIENASFTLPLSKNKYQWELIPTGIYLTFKYLF